MTQGLWASSPGTPVRPTVARTATASSTPRTAVAASGIVHGVEKPDTAACGADAAPVSNAAQTAQLTAAGDVVLLPTPAGGLPRGRRRFISTRSCRPLAAAGAARAARSAAV